MAAGLGATARALWCMKSVTAAAGEIAAAAAIGRRRSMEYVEQCTYSLPAPHGERGSSSTDE